MPLALALASALTLLALLAALAFVVERRRALFALWDECNDEESGTRARAVVVDFIRRELPRGTADAFTAAEIVALNRVRTAESAFAP